MLLEISKEYALKCHRETNHFYDDKPYEFHLEMVVNVARRFIHLIPEEFREIILSACWLHDAIEDTRQTYNDVREATSIQVADIVYALTNEKGKTRKERANDKYYEGIRNTEFAIFAKMCDRIANVEYSLSQGSGMADMYKKETPSFISKIYDSRYEEMYSHLREITGVEIKFKISEHMFNQLVEFLQSDSYSKEEAVSSLENATITAKSESVFEIKYNNDAIDIVRFENDKVIHLNPFKKAI